ncbi:MAG: hypothetical protein JSU09_01920 [Bacteroidetes bacterium]|nr:hypothetical protein [Bacteroidota bacterium]
MKKTAILMFALIVCAMAFAADPSLAVVNGKESIVKVIYRAETAENVRVKIYNQAGELVFTEVVKGYNAFMLPVNFDGLPYGQYTVEVSGNSGTKSQKVDYNRVTKAVAGAVTAAPVKAVHVAKVGEGSKYLMSVSNEGSQRINVRIFDAANNLIHTESRSINGSYGMIYNLEQIVGNPTFEVTDKSGNTVVVKK